MSELVKHLENVKVALRLAAVTGEVSTPAKVNFTTALDDAITMIKKNENRFVQGYLCAVSALIQMHGGVETQTKELFGSGAGKYDVEQMRSWGIDEHDIEVFEKHKNELI